VRSKNPRRPRPELPILIGIDTGGTFTDIVAMIDGSMRLHKLPSTPGDPAEAVLSGLNALLKDRHAETITYSSTVATNALLERKGARVAIVIDRGFEDLIEIGRQNRTELYSLAPSRPEPLVTRELRFGTDGRTLFDGTIEKPLGSDELQRLRLTIAASGTEAVAICLLHSYANPRSEALIAQALEDLRLPLSISHRILPEYREYERLSTTVVNAYVAPRMVAHLENLEQNLSGSSLRVMQSNGGAIGAELAKTEPIRTILSGPAAGVVGAAELVQAIGVDRFITFDMGGTSTDVALFDRRARIRTLSYPAGYPVRTPVIDIHTVGAGGGSLATLDEGGSLKVGPESAGADPGPACYGRGEKATVTDADLVAGRLLSDNFLGGKMRLYSDRAARALEPLARAMHTDVAAAARGIIRVVNANMERALRVITIERGFDPRDFALLAFGGAGPMHACELALDLGIRHIVLPPNPGLLCAWGAVNAPQGRELSITVRESRPELRVLERRARPLIERAHRELKKEGASPNAIRHEIWADLRYLGQSYELEVRIGPKFLRDFHEAHRRTFGHAAPDAPIEAVNVRVRAYAPRPKLQLPRPTRGTTPHGTRRITALVGKRLRSIPVYQRDEIGAGKQLRGPCIILELSSTTYVAPEFRLRADGYGNLHLENR
jgi:N-methylhydantoinase A